MNLNEEKYKLNKNIPIPLYFQIKRMILNELSSGNLKEGDQLPTENEFCDSLNVSRPTVRQALNELVSEGILIRKKKSGTFVAQPKIELPIHIGAEKLRRHIENTGRENEVVELDLCSIDAVEEINRKLQLDPKEELIYLKRLWIVGETPIAYTATYLSKDKFALILDKDFTQLNLLEFLKIYYDIEIENRVSKIDSALASKFDLELLEINRTRAPLLCITDIGQTPNQEPIFYSITRYRGDKVSICYFS